jgi:hypothetical protein
MEVCTAPGSWLKSFGLILSDRVRPVAAVVLDRAAGAAALLPPDAVAEVTARLGAVSEGRPGWWRHAVPIAVYPTQHLTVSVDGSGSRGAGTPGGQGAERAPVHCSVKCTHKWRATWKVPTANNRCASRPVHFVRANPSVDTSARMRATLLATTPRAGSSCLPCTHRDQCSLALITSTGSGFHALHPSMGTLLKMKPRTIMPRTGQGYAIAAAISGYRTVSTSVGSRCGSRW